MTFDHPVSLSFTAASLRPELARVVAEAYLESRCWDLAKRKVLSANALQARSAKSSERMEREMRQRLKRLTSPQIKLLGQGVAEERTAISWLAALKASTFIFEFASETLRDKLSALDPVLRASDYETFFESQCARHPEALSLAPTSRAKVRTVLLTMLREAGIGRRSARSRELLIQRPFIPPAVDQAIRADSPRWLAGFLVPDSEISF